MYMTFFVETIISLHLISHAFLLSSEGLFLLGIILKKPVNMRSFVCCICHYDTFCVGSIISPSTFYGVDLVEHVGISAAAATEKGKNGQVKSNGLPPSLLVFG